jgi:hypothetical protein
MPVEFATDVDQYTAAHRTRLRHGPGSPEGSLTGVYARSRTRRESASRPRRLALELARVHVCPEPH